MSQAWVQVAGLIVEFAGVLLLAWEWFAAKRQDAAERAIEKAHAMREEGMMRLAQVQPANPAMQRHFEMTRDSQRRMTELRIDDTRRSWSGMRTRAVAAALLLVSLGFFLQLAGSWPGCCRLVGIVPAG